MLPSLSTILPWALLFVGTALAQYQYGTCAGNGQNGVCISTSECSGSSTAGLCPGPSNIQCCTYGRCSNAGVTGTCESRSACSGTAYSGLCPGPSDIQCCVRGGGGGGDSGGACPPSVQPNIIDFIKSFEGFEASPYKDVAGFPTVGYGHLCETDGCTELPYSYPMSQAEGEELIADDVREFEICLGNAVSSVGLNANQYGALVSWSFNVGCGNMRSSTLVRRLNEGESPNTVAAEELPKWNKAGGQTVPGLTRRRQEEVQLFQTSTSVAALPC